MTFRNANRIPTLPSCLCALSMLVFCFGLATLRSDAAESPKSSGKVLVKVRASLAQSIESVLPLQTMEIVSGKTGNARVDGFLSRYSVSKARPMYPGMTRLKKQKGLTDLQIATAI